MATIAPNWPAVQIEMVPIADLIPYIRNPRQHSEGQILQLASSLKEFGWTMPVLRGEDNGIITGHGRIMAAQKLGWPDCARGDSSRMVGIEKASLRHR